MPQGGLPMRAQAGINSLHHWVPLSIAPLQYRGAFFAAGRPANACASWYRFVTPLGTARYCSLVAARGFFCPLWALPSTRRSFPRRKSAGGVVIGTIYTAQEATALYTSGRASCLASVPSFQVTLPAQAEAAAAKWSMTTPRLSLPSISVLYSSGRLTSTT